MIRWELHNADSFELMKSMPDSSVDVTITDPPYAEKTHTGARTGRPDLSLLDFSSITDESFMHLCTELLRVTKRWVIMTCDYRHASMVTLSDLPLVRYGVWIKPDSAPQFTGDRPGMGWESVLILHREGKKQWNGGGHHAVWTNKIERGNVHPTQKPLTLVREWVRLFSNKGEVILDPFAGSCTTGAAAIIEGRKFIGCELDSKYIDGAMNRLREAELQSSLFDEECKVVEKYKTERMF